MLVEFIRASIAGDEKSAESIIRGITPESCRVKNIFLRANLTVKKIELDKQPLQVRGTIKRAIKQRNLDAFYRLYFKGVDLKGKFLVHRALEEDQNTMLEALLIAQLDPNEKDRMGNTPLFLAASRGNLEAAFLLLAFGATLEPHIVTSLKEVAKSRDPLYISQADRWLCVGTAVSWAAQGILNVTGSNRYLDYLPLAINLIGSAAVVYNHVPNIPLVGVISCLELIPGVNYVVKLAKTASVVASAYTGLKSSLTHYHNRPWQAVQKGVVHTVNTLQSLKTLFDTMRLEYSESEFFKRAFEKRLNPADTDGYSGWTCDTYEKLFRKEALTCHPDRKGDSNAQMVLVAARHFWKVFCEEEPISEKEAETIRLLSNV